MTSIFWLLSVGHGISYVCSLLRMWGFVRTSCVYLFCKKLCFCQRCCYWLNRFWSLPCHEYMKLRSNLSINVLSVSFLFFYSLLVLDLIWFQFESELFLMKTKLLKGLMYVCISSLILHNFLFVVWFGLYLDEAYNT